MNRALAPAQALLIAACAWVPACGLNQAGVAPPSDTIAYPASAVMDRSGGWLFVTNSNADLRYNDGTLMAFSLTRAAADRGQPTGTYGPCPQVDYANPRSDDIHLCCWDAVDNNILNCDERGYVGPDSDPGNGTTNVRIGSFAAGMVLQHPRCPAAPCTCGGISSTDDFSSPDDRLLLGVRGDTSLTYVEVTSNSADKPPDLRCVTDATMPGTPAVTTCDDAHRIINTPTALAAPMEDPQNSPAVPLPDEPYALAIDYDSGLLYIGHLTGSTARPFSGGFSLFDIAPRGDGSLDAPRYIAPFPSPVPPNSLGAVGVTALNVHRDSYGTNDVFASSRYVPEVASLGTTATCPTVGASVREIAAFPTGITYSSPLLGGETRGIQFLDNKDPAQTRAFVLQRSPPTLIGFVASNMAPTDLLETCGSPTFLDKYDSGVGDRLFVTCFADGEVYVYDPSVPELVKTFSVGRGPAGLVFDNTNGRNVAYVVGFGDNNVSVIDLTPGSRTEYHVVQRIGFPRTAPR